MARACWLHAWMVGANCFNTDLALTTLGQKCSRGISIFSLSSYNPFQHGTFIRLPRAKRSQHNKNLCNKICTTKISKMVRALQIDVSTKSHYITKNVKKLFTNIWKYFKYQKVTVEQKNTQQNFKGDGDPSDVSQGEVVASCFTCTPFFC